ncbi:hypothetical protein VTJ04DRAFT_6893 [Mycothermus thermophilus]|uniref:uncharacterized protein n=1 Tax=Humicola insolens TaxID=85995 RepID=UPI0037429BB1
MKVQTALSLVFALVTHAAGQQPDCRCIPGQRCWPSRCEWFKFKKELGGNGKLIETSPIAESCYDGPKKDLDKCAFVTQMWSDQDFQTSNPIGRPYPYNITCAPVDYANGATPTTCSLGQLPPLAVNATSREDIAATLAFVQKHNIRLVVTGTGHDLLGRSDGYGGLELWLRHFRNSITFQETFESETGCTASNWTGSAIKIDGNYQWRDVYKVARDNNVITVGGGALSPGAIGGWPSGGGHGPATRNFGFGADQILEIEVMLANGTIVRANHCQNTDLFRAMRGGGPGYGIALSNTIKAHPNVDSVIVHKLAVAPYVHTPENPDLLDAVTTLLQQMPDLSDGGFAGYGYWFREFPRGFIGDIPSGYAHGFWAINKTREEAETVMNATLALLAPFQDRLLVVSSWAEYSDYWSFYYNESGLYDPTGDTSILTSRLIDPEAVSDRQRVRDAVQVISGEPGVFTSNVILLVSGGKVFEDAADPTSGLHPAWRRSHFAIITGQNIPKVATNEQRQFVNDQVTYIRGEALKALAPNTGGYMNEGDRHDPDYINSFYGSNYPDHLAAKNKYDPDHVFYCPTCVGAENWIERPDGPLCRKLE